MEDFGGTGGDMGTVGVTLLAPTGGTGAGARGGAAAAVGTGGSP